MFGACFSIVGNSTRRAKHLLRAWSLRGGNSLGWVWRRSTMSETRDTYHWRSMPFSVATFPHITTEQLPHSAAGVGMQGLPATDCRRTNSASVLQGTATKASEAGDLYYRWILAALFGSRWVLESPVEEMVSASEFGVASQWHCCVSGQRAVVYLYNFHLHTIHAAGKAGTVCSGVLSMCVCQSVCDFICTKTDKLLIGNECC